MAYNPAQLRCWNQVAAGPQQIYKDSQKYAFAESLVSETAKSLMETWQWPRSIAPTQYYTGTIKKFVLGTYYLPFYTNFLATANMVLSRYKKVLQPIVRYQTAIGYDPMELLVFGSFLGFYCARLCALGFEHAPDHAAIAIANALKFFDDTEQFEHDGWVKLEDSARKLLSLPQQNLNALLRSSKTGMRIEQLLAPHLRDLKLAMMARQAQENVHPLQWQKPNNQTSYASESHESDRAPYVSESHESDQAPYSPESDENDQASYASESHENDQASYASESHENDRVPYAFKKYCNTSSYAAESQKNNPNPCTPESQNHNDQASYAAESHQNNQLSYTDVLLMYSNLVSHAAELRKNNPNPCTPESQKHNDQASHAVKSHHNNRVPYTTAFKKDSNPASYAPEPQKNNPNPCTPESHKDNDQASYAAKSHHNNQVPYNTVLQTQNLIPYTVGRQNNDQTSRISGDSIDRGISYVGPRMPLVPQMFFPAQMRLNPNEMNQLAAWFMAQKGNV